MTLAPQIKGWCPGAYKPMMSGDGLIVRIRPRLGRLDADQTKALCALSHRFGNGSLELTSRANVQLRGISQDAHEDVLQELHEADLLDISPDTENRRNILTTPDWHHGDLTTRLYDALIARLDHLPVLPAKMGVALDTGQAPLLTQDPGDFRFETSRIGVRDLL